MTNGRAEPEDERGRGAAEQRPRTEYGRIARITVTVLAIIGMAWVLLTLSRMFMLAFAAVVLAVIFHGLSRGLRWLGVPHFLTLPGAIILLLAVLVGVFTLFGTQLVQEFDTIRDSVPRAIDAVRAWLDDFGLGGSVQDMLSRGSSDLSGVASRAGTYLLAAGSGLADLVLIFFGAIFLAADPAVYRRGLLLLVPQRAEEAVHLALDDATRGLGGWLRGQALSSVVVVIFTGAGLALLGVPASGALGLIAGLLDIIPLVGPVIAGVPAVLLAFTVSPLTALWTLGLFVVIQQLQGNVLQPMIQKRAVDVPPAVLLFAVVGAGMLFGILGVLLAAPLTVVAYVLIQRIYVRTLLGKRIKIAGKF